MKNWILAARPKTLPAAIVPVWVGSAPVLLGETGSFSWVIFAATLMGCLCIQIATNLFNDAIDADKGADTADRLGPKRVTATGLISRKAVMGVAFGFCVLGALAAIPLILKHGWIPIAIGGVSFLLAYCYTGGPFPLAYRGMGELFVIIFFGLVAVLGTYFMQTGEWFDPPGLVVALQVGFYSTVLIAINNLRDIDEDRRSDKRTLAARFGKTFARWEIGFFCFAPLFMWFLYGPTGLRTVGSLATSFLLASFITLQVFTREPGRFYNKLLAVGALQLINFAIWFSIWNWR
ncbi:MAG: 1,4-dihydroxy-2-naphthoate octaprenyltransferase [Verrucomicrobiales bacterium]|nr:1,4-dihydroxy-2-naphthoate octaprenyltransferase [Verrucomicrobiales bacterium]